MFSLTAMDNLLRAIAIPQLGLNWIDFLILAVFFFYAFEGIAVGFFVAFLDLLSFLISFLLGLAFYALVGGLFVSWFGMPEGFANATGFFLTAFISEMFLGFFLRVFSFRFVSLVPKDLRQVNKVFGFVPSIASAFILLSFLLTVIVALPLSPILKQAVSSARFGKILLVAAQDFEKKIQAVFGGAVLDTLNFLTVKPQSDEFVKLRFSTSAVSIDELSEQEMLLLVNKERKAHGLPPLVADELLTTVARRHATDMFAKGYFSHYTPEGLSPFDRMAQADVSYTVAGENLALAPDVSLAMQGFMKSPGHRANILSSQFGRVGIGGIYGGIYGKMFVQEFTN